MCAATNFGPILIDSSRSVQKAQGLRPGARRILLKMRRNRAGRIADRPRIQEDQIICGTVQKAKVSRCRDAPVLGPYDPNSGRCVKGSMNGHDDGAIVYQDDLDIRISLSLDAPNRFQENEAAWL